MNKQQLMQSIFEKDPRGCSAGDIALALNKRWPSRNSENFMAANAFLKQKHTEFRKKREEFHNQKAAMEIAEHFFHVFMGKIRMGCPDEDGGFILGLKYDMPEAEKPVKKQAVVIRGMGGNPFVGL
jgi:hypothetical protein